MKHILSPGSRGVLERFARAKVLLGLDYDGTLAPIVGDPDRAVMRPSTRELLARAAELYPTVIVSGRAQGDVLARVQGVAIRQIVGNHGLEPWHGSAAIVEQVRGWRSILEAHVGRISGVWVEDKGYSVAVHYRGARDKEGVRAAVGQAIAQLGPVRIVGGKQVVNVLPEGAPHKGTALERERERLGCDTAIYVGDDETDEDVFALGPPGRLLTIRVGAKRTSAASHYIPRQAAIDALLHALVELRTAPGPEREVAQ